MATKRFFAFDAWAPGVGEFWLIRANADWVHGDFWNNWLSLTVALFGFCASLTWYPKGQRIADPEWVLHYRGEPWLPADDTGREHGEAGE